MIMYFTLVIINLLSFIWLKIWLLFFDLAISIHRMGQCYFTGAQAPPSFHGFKMLINPCLWFVRPKRQRMQELDYKDGKKQFIFFPSDNLNKVSVMQQLSTYS